MAAVVLARVQTSARAFGAKTYCCLEPDWARWDGGPNGETAPIRTENYRLEGLGGNRGHAVSVS